MWRVEFGTGSVMKVIVPSIIHVGAHPFRVSRVRGLSDATDNQALSNSTRLYISVEDDRPRTVTTQAFFHEIVHMALHIYNGDEKKIPHAIHDAIAEGFLQLLTEMGIEFDFSGLPVDDIEGSRENWA